MNEDLDSQLSAMFDDELPETQCELLARRLARDEMLKARWGRYAVIGAAARAERGVRLDGSLARRISAAISAEPALAVPPAASRAGSPSRARWWQPVAGAALAAGVAGVALVYLRGQAPMTVIPAGGEPVAAVSTPVRSPVSSQPGTYIVPTVAERPVTVPAAELANYVVAHSEFSTPLSRRNLLSALVASEPGTAGAAEQSEEQFEDSADNASQAP